MVEEKPRGQGIRRSVGELLTCQFLPRCVGGLLPGFVLLPRVSRLVAAVFAAVTVSDFMHQAYKALEEKGVRSISGGFSMNPWSSFFTALPAFMINLRLLLFQQEISSSGFPSTTSRSASLPTSTVPISFSPKSSALVLVAKIRLSMGLMTSGLISSSPAGPEGPRRSGRLDLGAGLVGVAGALMPRAPRCPIWR